VLSEERSCCCASSMGPEGPCRCPGCAPEEGVGVSGTGTSSGDTCEGVPGGVPGEEPTPPDCCGELEGLTICCGMLLPVLWPPPRIDGSVLACELLLPPSEDSSAVEQSSHTQHERLLPTPTSRTVMRISPTRHEIPAAARLPNMRERRLGRDSEANLEKGRFILSKRFRKEDFFRKPPGMVVTAPGTRARYTFRKSTPAVIKTEDKNSPTSVPPIPKREVMAAAAGDTIPTARTLGRSKTLGCWGGCCTWWC
jgi:hypothetical protein